MTGTPERLLQEVGSLPPTRFAVVDGAMFDDLPKALGALRLDHRPLYFEGADIDTIKAGPFLVRTDSYPDAVQLLTLIGERRTGVFWSSPNGMDDLYRHLRTLNLVQIALVDAPRNAADYQTVLFRHADPNVLAAMIAVMDAGQRQELLGRSPALVYSLGAVGGVRSLRAGG
ncbi:DUF4123 domain-containing protein [Sphingomonas parva]|uniref:DUF4123 domain-containing protein n=1 Tax=Sphingomonas parva TaxID=2555898 RepID=A0A4Y8ZVF5_9SPHN|nr:DUF4123 domain-containing protein [Sphingomonas parva]TFI58719.1 DUF4123 domain-containing protein [Sphingomonas parva]